MRKYIYKFKNYTSVEVDHIHDLKEGDCFETYEMIEVKRK